jgi:2-methylcitrate dehydratase PrpD
MEGLTDALCERIAALRYEDLGPDTVARVKDAIGDGLSVAVAGSTEKPVAILADYVRSLESAPRSTVWGYGFKSSAASAALVNAASAHVLDYEPMSSPSTHAVSPVMPVAFALAEVRDCSGRDIVTACAKGFEMQHRLLYAGKLPPRSDRRFHQVGMVVAWAQPSRPRICSGSMRTDCARRLASQLRARARCSATAAR